MKNNCLINILIVVMVFSSFTHIKAQIIFNDEKISCKDLNKKNNTEYKIQSNGVYLTRVKIGSDHYHSSALIKSENLECRLSNANKSHAFLIKNYIKFFKNKILKFMKF